MINFISEDTIEHHMLATLAQKQTLANGVLDGMGDLDAMPLPSARMQILEQLDDLLVLESEIPHSKMPSASKADPLETIKNDAIAHF